MKVREVREGKGGYTSYKLSLPLPPRFTAGWPTMCVFVTVSEAHRYLATTIQRLTGYFHGNNCCEF
jgi:hypothetical protein